jgi:Zn-finger nucleic acid-binding protein
MCVKVEQVWLDGGSLAKLAAPIRFNNLNKLTANDLKKNELLSTERFIKSVSLKYLDHQFINFLRCRRTEKGGSSTRKKATPDCPFVQFIF